MRKTIDNFYSITIDKIFDKLNTLIKEKSYNEALDLIRFSLHFYQDDIILMSKYAYCYIEIRRFSEAKKILKNALSRSPENESLHLVQVHWLKRRRKFKKAETKLVELRQKYNNSIKYCLRFINLYQSKSEVYRYNIKRLFGMRRKILNKINAEAETIRVVFQNPIISEQVKIEVYTNIKAFRLAHKSAGDYIGLMPDDPYGYICKAYLCILQNQPILAKNWVIEGLRYDPQNKQGLIMLALIKSGAVKRYTILRIICYTSLLYVFCLVPSWGAAPFMIFKSFLGLVGIFESWKFKKYKKALSSIELKTNF